MGRHSNEVPSRSRGVLVVALFGGALAALVPIGVVSLFLRGRVSSPQTTVSEVSQEPAVSTTAKSDDASSEPVVEDEAPEELVVDGAMLAAEAAVHELADPYGSSVAVAVLPVSEGAGFSINQDEEFVAASMIKLLVLASYMAEVDKGAIDPAASYTIAYQDLVGGSGNIQGAGAGFSYSYGELARQMIATSDNVATNVLINTLGIETINTRADELGFVHTRLQRLMMDQTSGLENYISAQDAATLLQGIAAHSLASEAACTSAESYLAEQVDELGLKQGLPVGVGFAHKTGSLDSVRHDGGIVYGEKPYVIVVLTSLDAETANNLMSQISSAVYTSLS